MKKLQLEESIKYEGGGCGSMLRRARRAMRDGSSQQIVDTYVEAYMMCVEPKL